MVLTSAPEHICLQLFYYAIGGTPPRTILGAKSDQKERGRFKRVGGGAGDAFCIHFGAILDSFWTHFWQFWDSFWHVFWMSLSIPFWDRFWKDFGWI